MTGRGARWLLLVWVVLGACARREAAPAAAPAVTPPSAAATPTPTPTETGQDQAEGALAEEPGRDARAEMVTIKIVTEPRRPAHVLWGRKDLGTTPLEIVRPRGSGPLDLVLTAPGFLPLHTRALTDRDDTLTLRLYGENEGPALLGYHP